MENNLMLFKNDNFGEIRTLFKDGEVWFVGNDVCKCLEVGNTSQAISRLDEEEKNTIILNEGIGNPEKTIINESGLYSLVLSSRKPEAKKFKKWVTSEVLPSIRKTGGYIVSKPDETDQELLARALLVVNETLKRKEERLKALEEKAEADKPLVEFAEKVSLTNELLSMEETAKLLGTGRNSLFKLLKTEGILKSDNIPYQRFIEGGYFKVKEQIFKYPNGEAGINLKTLVTGKGQLYLQKKFFKKD